MTQYGYEPLSPEDGGTTLLERLNGVVPALLTNHKGAARPAYVQPGMMWIDDSGATWLLNIYDGTSDVALAKIDPATHAIVDLYLKLDGSQALTEAQKSALRAVLGTASLALAGTKASKRNRHINPAFQICQDRAIGVTVALSSGAYILDGVSSAISGGGVLTCSQVAKLTPGGSPYRARGAVTTADVALAASDIYAITLPIEGADVADLMFGTAAAKPFIWRGVVNLPAGTYGLSFGNGAGTRSYLTTFTISAVQANSDILVTVDVPGDTAGAWILDASGAGLWVRLCLAAGSNYQTANTGVWQAGNYLATPAQTNGMASTANTFEVADIGLFEGTELPAWEMPSYAEDLRKCRCYRRYAKVRLLSNGGGSYGGALADIDVTEMRAVPALSVVVTASDSGTVASEISAGVYNSSGYKTAVLWFNTAKALGKYAELTVTFDARL